MEFNLPKFFLIFFQSGKKLKDINQRRFYSNLGSFHENWLFLLEKNPIRLQDREVLISQIS